MAMIKSERGQLAENEAEDRAIEDIHVLSSFDGQGPTVGAQFVLKDGSKVTVKLPTTEAYALGLELLAYVQVAHEKHGRWLDDLG